LARRRLRDHPSAGEDFKAGRTVGTLVEFRRSTDQVWQGRGEASHRRRPSPANRWRGQGKRSWIVSITSTHITILHVGSMDFGADEPAGGVGHDMTFATFDLSVGIPRVAALARPRTDSTARPAAFGPIGCRSPRPTGSTRDQPPHAPATSSRQAQKQRCTVERGENRAATSATDNPSWQCRATH